MKTLRPGERAKIQSARLAGCEMAFRTLLSLSVISPRGGELNTIGVSYRNEAGRPPPNLPLVRGRDFPAIPISMLQPTRSRKAKRANESARCESKRKEASFIPGCGKTFIKKLVFPHPATETV